jgi:hypothetical protein
MKLRRSRVIAAGLSALTLCAAAALDRPMHGLSLARPALASGGDDHGGGHGAGEHGGGDHGGGGESGGGSGGGDSGSSGSGGSGSGNSGDSGNSGSGSGGSNGSDESGPSTNSGHGADDAAQGEPDNEQDDESGPAKPAHDDETDDTGPGAKTGHGIDSEHVDGSHDRAIRSEVVVTDAGDSLSAFARAKGFRVLHEEKLDALGVNVTRLQTPAGVSATQARAILASAFPNAVIDLNHLYQPQASLNLPAPDYAMRAVRWNAQLQSCAPMSKLGLIDTGVDWSLPILSGARGRSAGFVDAGVRVAPADHGTGIATLLVGQRGFGLMPQAELYAADIFGIDLDGRPVASATSFAKALNWLLANNVPTINVSLSGPPDQLMQLAVQRAQARGAHLVAAVGNDGTEGVPRFPAAYPGVIGVTAIDQSKRAWPQANRGDFVTLAAPGVDLLIPGQPGADGKASDRLVTGTSFAAPYVSATLASFGNDSKRMIADALDLGPPGPDPVFGSGLVQAPKVCLAVAQ